MVLQADEERLHHSEVHGEAIRSAALSRRCNTTAGSVRGGQEQRHPVSDPGLRRGGGPEGGHHTAQRTRKTLTTTDNKSLFHTFDFLISL